MSTLPPGYPQPISYASPGPAGTVCRDVEHLNILGICHYVWGGMLLFFGCFGLVYIVMGLLFISGRMPGSSGTNVNAPPPELGWFFIIIGGGLMLLFWSIGILGLFAGRCLRTRRHRTFCLVVAGFNCLSIPVGTVLGVFTFIVLTRPAMPELFAAPPTPPG